MYFKSDYHEELFNTFAAKLDNDSRYYTVFAYVASAIGKKKILEALRGSEVDFEYLLEMSGVWSGSERAMLEAACQLFSGNNLYEDGFTNIDNLFYSLDSENTQVILAAINYRYN